MIGWESVLFLGSALITGRLLSVHFLAPMIQMRGGVLLLDLILYGGWVVFTWLGLLQPAAARRRFWVVLGTTLLVVLLMAFRQADVRAHNPLAVSDSAVQTEEAAKFIFRGVNPYAADFRPTPFGRFPSGYDVTAPNVAWTHYAYPPATFLTAVPAVLLFRMFHATPDVRWLYVIGLLALVWLLLTLTRDWRRRTMVVLLTLGNPFVWMYAVAGFHDFMLALWLVLAAVMATRRRMALAGFVFGLALMTKQTAWLLIPTWLMWLWLSYKRQWITWPQVRTALLWSIGTSFMIILPFVIWNLPALYDDTIRYVAGAIPHSYPFSGSTALQYLYLWGLTRSPWALVPAWPFQLLVALPSYALAFVALRQKPTAGGWLFSGAAIMISVMLFSRFFFENYAAMIMTLLLAAVLLDARDHAA